MYNHHLFCKSLESLHGLSTLNRHSADGHRKTFDHIIYTCHSHDALRILDAGSGATPTER